jgi:hypothetical protein
MSLYTRSKFLDVYGQKALLVPCRIAPCMALVTDDHSNPCVRCSDTHI